MVERRPVIEQERIEYEGLFKVKEVYQLLYDWMSDKGYVPVEKRVTESVTKSGKHIEVELEPYKKYTDYAKSVVRVKLHCSNVTDVEVTVEGHKRKMQKGKVQVSFDSWLETDYEHRWESQPVFYVLRTMFEKYVYAPFIGGFYKGVRDDTLHLKEQVKSYLNLTRFSQNA
jgi:hypothetical protein